MNQQNQYEWVDFYKEFAEKLLTYKNDRQELILKVKQIYKDTSINLPTLGYNKEIIDIDPFTVLALFNKSSMKDENRVKIIIVISKLFNIQAKVPKSFFGIPVLNNMNATFYSFQETTNQENIDQLKEDIDQLWEFFEAALAYITKQTDATKQSFIHYFDLVINKKGNGNSKITMALYWISPETFLNLDSRNTWYIFESGKLPESLIRSLPKVESKISAKIYLDIVEQLRDYLHNDSVKFQDFKDLSYEAWRYSHEVNEIKRQEKILRESKGSGLADEDVDAVHYWFYIPGESTSKWDDFFESGIMAIGWGEIGDLSQFTSKEKIRLEMEKAYNSDDSYKNKTLACWQFVNEMKVGDIIFARKGPQELVGRGIVISDYAYDDSVEDGYNNIRQVKWTHNVQIHFKDRPQLPTKTLIDITTNTNMVEQLISLFEEIDTEKIDMDTDLELKEKNYPQYDKNQFLKDVFMDEKNYDTLVDLLRNKMNIILQGAPGVGKTYVAKRLAYSILGEKNPNQVMMVQFHQSYTYEDFIEGFRPSNQGLNFDIKKGSFYTFCRKAKDDIDNNYFFIIDEINRGNISKIFGELFMLIENDKRGNELQLLYSDEKFSVPKNMYIIGMMNTADRSLAMLDYALRRRFAFFEMEPGFVTDGFRQYRTALGSPKFDNLISCIEQLNIAISEDESLGEGFRIGHSYFSNHKTVDDDSLSRIIEYEIIPLLKEYWFDQPNNVIDWSASLRSCLQ